ncbi:AfsR/SARP family transcriptional regulator [Spongiactinospora rosea]|uniref:AfsR/SARP family transcriptional regulator n=1 Tax=Spongiactinospora rosea TaxID=2248750 RepID=A0A366LNG9_9ACTN|nr:BTAD domain-containing putative transcriptional regulator [Spongiactinospora rosea]RBQ15468.1 AfsR/SARP family transcriptional regulator [Spongiactinospora rosea]
MRFGILGPIEAWTSGGDPVPVGGPRSRTLLALLLLAPGRTVGVDRLVSGQYGERPPADATGALQAQVSRLRRRLPPGLLEYGGAGYRLAIDPADVDAHRFQLLARQGRDLLAAGRAGPAAAVLREALGLWRGPALADATDVPLVAAQRTRLEELRLTATEDRVEAELADAVGSGAAAELRPLLAAHPLRERLAVLLMRALHAEGRQAEALEVYERVRRRLADELGADPSPELAAAHLAILRAGDPPPARPSVLPVPLTGFVGRETELDLLAGVLAPGTATRLVTITGPGGTGKTRLAIEAARRHPGAVCLVSLADINATEQIPHTAETTHVHPGTMSSPPQATESALRDLGKAYPDTQARRRPGATYLLPSVDTDGGEQVARAVLGALGLRDPRGLAVPPEPADPGDRLVTALRERGPLLLILDNCEHVIAATAALARRLLDSCPELTVLATGREPLAITGETLVRLAPLACPPDGAAAREAAGYPAVRLFAERAAAARHGFALSDGNAAAVTRICAALDGLPLALELAAARLRTFTVAEIADRLAEHGRFRLLSRGDRTAAARHQTLRAVVEWSWDLLGPEERALAGRFSVFSGGATLEAAERVCGGGDTAGLLADLVDKSLVETDGDRYRMLSTIRLFCAERRAAAETPPTAEAAHAAYYLDLARRAGPHLLRAAQLDWLALLSAEHANLMAALRWAVDADPATALRLVAAGAAYLWFTGRRSEVVPLATRLLRTVDALPSGWVEREDLVEEYGMCVVHAVPNVTPAHRERVEATLLNLGRPLRHPFAAPLWGMIIGPPFGADNAVLRRRLLGPDPWAHAVGALGEALLTLLRRGEVAAAEHSLAAVLAGFRALGERWGMAQALDWLALIASLRGDWERADALWAEALALFVRLGSAEEETDVLCRRAEALTRRGDLDAAAADCRRAAGLARQIADTGLLSLVRLRQAEIARFRGDLGEARELLTAALEEARGQVPDVHIALGRVAQAAGDVGEAVRRYDLAAETVPGEPLTSLLAAVPEAQAARALLTGEAEAAGERAALLLGAAVALRGLAVAGDRDVAGTAGAARARIGPRRFAAAFARGAAMSHEEALTALGRPPADPSAERR